LIHAWRFGHLDSNIAGAITDHGSTHICPPTGTVVVDISSKYLSTKYSTIENLLNKWFFIYQIFHH